MSDVSPEDRERLVDIRFGELFDRHLKAKLPEVFDHRLMEWAELSGQQSHQPQRATAYRPLPPTSSESTRPAKKRSLFEISLAETLGLT